jgi:hypothetical protein
MKLGCKRANASFETRLMALLRMTEFRHGMPKTSSS